MNTEKPFFSLETKQKLTLINPTDSVIPRVLGLIAVDTNRDRYGSYQLDPSTDRLAILERQSIFKDLFEHKALRYWLLKKVCDKRLSWEVPEDASSFMAYFHSINRANFLIILTELKNLLQKKHLKLSKPLEDFYLKISEALDKQIVVEKYFSESIISEMKKLLQVQGNITFTLRQHDFNNPTNTPPTNTTDILNCVKSDFCFGWKKYSFMYSDSQISPGEIIDTSEISDNWVKKIWNFRKLRRIRAHNKEVWMLDEELKKLIDYSTLAIQGTVPHQIKKDIAEWFYDKFIMQTREADPFIASMKPGDAITINILFNLNNEGLYVTVSDANYYNAQKSNKVAEDIFEGVSPVAFKGYTGQEIEATHKKYKEFRANVFRRTLVFDENQKLYDYLSRRMPNFSDGLIEIPSRNSMEGINYNTFRQILGSDEYKETYKQINEARKMLHQELINLSRYAKISETFIEYAKSIGNAEYEFPEVIPATEHLLSFDSITPLHLLGRNNSVGKTIELQHLIPINSIGHLDGSIVCLTGQNAGGKTTTLEELISNIYQAQCGLPLFAKGFKFNPKEALAMVFLEKGEGSTLELLYRKTFQMLQSVSTFPKGRIMVFLDELGTGTQESAGLEFGQQLLSKLDDLSCSVVMTTQIRELAKYVNLIGGRCYKFDEKHRMSPGIGTGNAELLRRQIGLDQMLRVASKRTA